MFSQESRGFAVLFGVCALYCSKLEHVITWQCFHRTPFMHVRCCNSTNCRNMEAKTARKTLPFCAAETLIPVHCWGVPEVQHTIQHAFFIRELRATQNQKSFAAVLDRKTCVRPNPNVSASILGNQVGNVIPLERKLLEHRFAAREVRAFCGINETWRTVRAVPEITIIIVLASLSRRFSAVVGLSD